MSPEALHGDQMRLTPVATSKNTHNQSTAQAAGRQRVGTVGERPWGIYSGYFRDPDGHLWEVIHFLTTDQN
ncbi:hypothetical protein BST27_15160 [Mycobacterium intermedium]|uniref:Glyoxalase/fosfomycin resistance/dioxygenase domain-containing protein n=1 Tax=Mycobacterium intermedium TaxID=28445 RepID=A0A1E3SF05_MYCIE|nr:hypothetical protein [Mycobacterium intermedium]MCV6963144.1 hypothetical protein [Mycobacterium intermedium]ODR00729.1 hypothetical protein BHQ20_12155 [Mycobacterium intermedium]OPE45972.1 hypothetical protein BV508_27705 [Mycobacterium intermedium]ORB03676.1 hypothetical protein BST27_15160 [Mycobacterium intermedium]